MVINPCVCARPGQHAPDPATAEALAKALRLPLAYFYATRQPSRRKPSREFETWRTKLPRSS